ncbi:MAG: hypothetical protein MJ079_06720 [Ruminococcus sp.]|nr:hypothetical protein [Ruminococcus sp.]
MRYAGGFYRLTLFSLLAYIFVAEDMYVPEEMEEYSPRTGGGKLGELGYIYKVNVNSVSREDYDRLDDVMKEPPGIIRQ